MILLTDGSSIQQESPRQLKELLAEHCWAAAVSPVGWDRSNACLRIHSLISAPSQIFTALLVSCEPLLLSRDPHQELWFGYWDRRGPGAGSKGWETKANQLKAGWGSVIRGDQAPEGAFWWQGCWICPVPPRCPPLLLMLLLSTGRPAQEASPAPSSFLIQLSTCSPNPLRLKQIQQTLPDALTLLYHLLGVRVS